MSECEGHPSTHTCQMHGQDSSGGHPCAPRCVLVDLASFGRKKNPFDPVPSLSPATCVQSPTWEHLALSVRVPEISGLGALLRLRGPLFALRSIKWNENERVYPLLARETQTPCHHGKSKLQRWASAPTWVFVTKWQHHFHITILKCTDI